MRRKCIVRGLGLVICSLLVFGVVLDACDKYTHAGSVRVSLEDTVPKKLFLSDFMYIGEQHNAGLDFVLKKMVEARKEGKSLAEVTGKEFLVDATLAFICSDKDFSAHVESVKAKGAQLLEANMNLVRKGASAYVSEAQEFSVQQKKYLLALLDAGHHANTHQEFSDILHQTIQAVQQSGLSVREEYPIFAAAAVLSTSRQYWAEKETIWKNLLHRGNVPMHKSFIVPAKWSWNNFVDSDAIGAASGAAVAISVMAVFPVGWGVLATWAASSILGSAISATR